MKDSDLRFNILTAAAFGVVIILAPTAGRAADEASGLHIGAGVGQSDVDTSCGVATLSEHLGIRGEWEKFEQVGNTATGERDIQMWTVGLNYEF